MDLQNDPEIIANGTVIGGGAYEIVSHLAMGGMAHVYVAIQTKLNRRVALKVLNSSFCANHSVSVRFINEALIVAQLHHPRIVEVYDVGKMEDQRLFMAMELLEGKGLGARIHEGLVPPNEALSIIRQVAEGLAEAHSLGIIHRDLKPDNIFLTTKSGVKTLDFGIAKILHGDSSEETGEKLTRAGTAPGTPEYMSPEQARGQQLDARSDLYSLGIVLYEMLCGHPPFEEPTFLATILKQVQDLPPALPEFIPEDVANFVTTRLLAKDANLRPASADALIHEIDTLMMKQWGKTGVNDEKSLIFALSEIEALRSQLAQTQQELQRSRDMACLEQGDLDKDARNAVGVGVGAQIDALTVKPNADIQANDARPLVVKHAGKSGKSSGSSKAVSGAGLGALPPLSVRTNAPVPPEQEVSTKTDVDGPNEFLAENALMNGEAAESAQEPATATQPDGVQVKAGVIMPSISVTVGVPGQAPQPGTQSQRSGMMNAVSRQPNKVPPQPGSVPPQAPSQSQHSGMMNAVSRQPNKVPPQPGSVPPQPGSVPPQAPGQSQRSGMMNAVSRQPNKVPPQPGSVPPQAPGQSQRSGMMNAVSRQPNKVPPQPGSVPPQAPGQSQRSGMMNAIPHKPGSVPPPPAAQPMRGAGMNVVNAPNNAASQALSSNIMPALSPNAMLEPGQGRRPGSQVATAHAQRSSGNMGAQAPRQAVPTAPKRVMPGRPGMGTNASDQNGAQSVKSSKNASGAASCVISGMPEDAVVAPQMVEVMRSLDASSVQSRAANARPYVDQKGDEPWRPNESDFYNGCLRDDTCDPVMPAQKVRQPVRQPVRPEVDENGEEIIVPRPRFASQNASSNDGQYAREDVKRSSVSNCKVTISNRDQYCDDSEVNFNGRPRDVYTAKTTRKASDRIGSGVPKNTFMTFVQPLSKLFGPSHVGEMLHFAQGIWNAATLGGPAVQEIREAMSDNPTLMRYVDGMVGRKQKVFANEKWLIDDLNVDVDAQNHFVIDFTVIEL